MDNATKNIRSIVEHLDIVHKLLSRHNQLDPDGIALDPALTAWADNLVTLAQGELQDALEVRLEFLHNVQN